MDSSEYRVHITENIRRERRALNHLSWETRLRIPRLYMQSRVHVE